MPMSNRSRSVSKRVGGVVSPSSLLTAAKRTDLHAILMPLACGHLREAAATESRGESPLGHVAAFVLLSHCALGSFVQSTWQDMESAHPGKVERQITEAQRGEKRARGFFGLLRGGSARGKRRPGFYDFLKAVGKGADGSQCIDKSDLAWLKDYAKCRNDLLQHSLQQFGDAASPTTVRATLTLRYGEQTWIHLQNAMRAISCKYELQSAWLDRC